MSKIFAKLAKIKTPYKVVIIMVALLLLWFATGLVHHKKNVNKNSNEVPEEFNVKVRAVSKGSVEQFVTIFGQAESDNSLEIKAQVSSNVSRINVSKGNIIRAGSVILTLDKRSNESQYNSLQEIAKQKEIAFKSAESLYKKGLKSESTLMLAKSAFESAKANLKDANINLDNIYVKAPFDGFIDNIYTKEGAYVENGRTSLVKLVKLTPLFATGYVPEKFSGHVKNNQKAEILIGDRIVSNGYVSYVSRTVDEDIGSFKVEVKFINNDLRVAVGSSVAIRIILDKVNGYFIPTNALLIGENGDIGVKIVNNENKVEFKKVDIITSNSDGVWVSGLDGEVKVITLGQNFVNDNAKVKFSIDQS